MKAELQQQIFAKYPKMFGDRTKPMTETCMCWGLEVGDGWYNPARSAIDAAMKEESK